MSFRQNLSKYFFFSPILISFLIFSFTVSPVKADFVPSVENEIYVLVNQERNAQGLPPLVPESRLAIMARQHSKEMAVLNYFSHISPVVGFETLAARAAQAGITDWSLLGENIAAAATFFIRPPDRITDWSLLGENINEVSGFALDIMALWMDSPGHRANILDNTFTHIGVGIFFDPNDWEYLLTQNFGILSSPVPIVEDMDVDGVLNDFDNCPDIFNSDQSDFDGDDIGDVCDVCAFDPDNDIDGDGVCGDVDNCPNKANPDQSDSDGNGVGNACEPPAPQPSRVPTSIFGPSGFPFLLGQFQLPTSSLFTSPFRLPQVQATSPGPILFTDSDFQAQQFQAPQLRSGFSLTQNLSTFQASHFSSWLQTPLSTQLRDPGSFPGLQTTIPGGGLFTGKGLPMQSQQFYQFDIFQFMTSFRQIGQPFQFSNRFPLNNQFPYEHKYQLDPLILMGYKI